VADMRRVAILGVGHRLRRDDAAGPEVCDRMRAGLGLHSGVLVVDGGPAPENCIGALRAFDPDLVVVVDAAQMGAEPGAVRRLTLTEAGRCGASTHTLPLPAFCSHLQETLDCDVFIVGIEPSDTSFGEGLTPAVEAAVGNLARGGLDALAADRPGLDRVGGGEERAA
jgi:hydrogenase 3 maturation protease